MKHIKKTAIVLLVVSLLCSIIMFGCSSSRTEYSEAAIQSSAETAAKERVKTEISNNYKTFKIAKEKEDFVIDSITNDGSDWTVSGMVTLTNRSDKENVQTVDFSVSLQLIDYIDQPTPTYKLIDFSLGEIIVP